MFKELVSPFHSLFRFAGSKKQSRPPCNCDDDDEDCGMAPECAFVCNWLSHDARARAHKTSKKRRLNAHAHAHKKTKRVAHNDH